MLLFQFLEVGDWVVLGEKIVFYQKCSDCDFRLIGRPKQISDLGSPKVGEGGRGFPRLGHNPKFFCFFSDSSPEVKLQIEDNRR